MTTLADFRTKVDVRVVEDKAPIVDADRNEFILAAVREYSQWRPRKRGEDIAIAGGVTDLTVTDLDAWEDGLSRIVRIHDPFTESAPLHKSEASVQRDGASVQFIRFLLGAQVGPRTVRIVYDTVHAFDVAPDNLSTPASDEDAIADLAAAKLMRRIAKFYAQTKDSAVEADTVDFGAKTDNHLRTAEGLELAFRKHIGIEAPKKRRRGAVLFSELALDDREDPETSRAERL